ncbi:MAG: transposase [Cellvibrionaceae bacterium]|jgi:transposase
MFKRIGVELNRTNLANWMIKMGKLVEPLLKHYIAQLQQQNVLHMDDLGTPLKGRQHCKCWTRPESRRKVKVICG